MPGASIVIWAVGLNEGELLSAHIKVDDQEKAFQNYPGGFKCEVAFSLHDSWAVKFKILTRDRSLSQGMGHCGKGAGGLIGST